MCFQNGNGDDEENDEERKEDLVGWLSRVRSSLSCSLIKKKYFKDFASMKRILLFEWSKDKTICASSVGGKNSRFAVYVSGSWRPSSQHAWCCCCVVFFLSPAPQPRRINVFSLINDPPRFLAKTSNDSLAVKALSHGEGERFAASK